MKDHEKPFVVMVPQAFTDKAKPFFFATRLFAEIFADQTGGTLFARHEVAA